MEEQSDAGHRSTGRRARWPLAILTGLVGIVGFNVIVGVFGERLALVGLAAFVATAILVIHRSGRSEGEGNA